MRIERIKIKNFKNFEDAEFIFKSNFTVFIGENAKGKTSILDALAVVVGGFLRGIDVAKTEARSIEKKEVRVKTINGQPKPQLPVEIEAFGVVNSIKIEDGWKRSVNSISKKTTTTYVDAKNIEKIASDMLSESRKNGNVTFPVFAYHGTGRLWAEHEEKKVSYKKQTEGVEMAYFRCLSPKSSSKEFLSWYKTYEDEIRKFNSETDKILLQAFNKAVFAILPNQEWKEMAYSFKDDDLIGLFINSSGETHKLLFRQLSDGYRNTIGMVADIAYRCIKLNPHLGDKSIEDTPGIVLIDELDLHLHPKWQKRIVNDLKNIFKSIQFIATTHSPFVVQSLKSDELINLDNVYGLDLDPFKYSVEEISENEMGVKNVKRSNDFIEMQNKAKEYFELIKQNSNKEDISKAKDILKQVRIKYINDPAYVALLEAEMPSEDATC